MTDPKDSLVTENFGLSHHQETMLQYWAARKLSSSIPSRKTIDILDIHSVMPNVVIFDAMINPVDFRYRLVGTEVRENTFGDYTGKTLRGMEGKGPGSKIWELLERVRTEKQMSFTEVPYVGPKEFLLRSTLLMLPLSDDAVAVNMIFLVVAFRQKLINP